MLLFSKIDDIVSVAGRPVNTVSVQMLFSYFNLVGFRVEWETGMAVPHARTASCSSNNSPLVPHNNSLHTTSTGPLLHEVDVSVKLLEALRELTNSRITKFLKWLP